MQSGNDEAVVSLVIDASGLRQGSAEAVALGKRLIDSFKAVEAAANSISNVVSSSGVKIVESTSSTSRFLEQLERKLNPLTTAANKAKEEMERLIRVMGGTNVDAAKKASDLLELQTKRVLELQQAMRSGNDEYKQRMAFAKQAFDSETAGFEKLAAAQKSAANAMINDLKRLEVERQKTNVEGFKFQEQMAPRSNVAENTRRNQEILEFEKQIDREILNSKKQRLEQEVMARKSATDLMISDIKRFQSEQEKADRERKQFFTQMGPVAAPSSNIAQHNKELDDTARKAKEAADRLDQLTVKFSQDATAANNYRKTIKELNEVFNARRIGYQELSVETSKAIDTYNKSTVAGQKATQAHKDMASGQKQVTDSSRLMNYALTNMTFQINDVISGVMMGQQPFRIFAQQAGQFVQIFQQSPTVLGDLGRLISSWITPTTLAVAGLVALGAALAVIIGRVVSNESQIRKFNVELGGIGFSSNTSSIGLQKLSFELRAVGLSATEAEKGILDLSHNLSTNLSNPNSLKMLTQLGLDVGARLGIGSAAGMAKVNEMIKDQGDAVVKLGLDTRAFSQIEAAAISIDIQRGNSIKTINDAIKLLIDRLKDQHKNSLSASQEAVNSLGGAWNTLLNTIANTTAFNIMHDAMVRMIRDTTDFINTGKLPENHWINTLLMVVPGGSVLAAILAIKDIKLNLPTAGEMGQRAQGLIRPEASVYGPGAKSLSGGVESGIPLVSGGALTGAQAKITIGVDPRVLEVFEITKAITGEGAVITPHGGTGGQHVSGSQHYPRNTTSGMGLALDFKLPDKTTGQPLPYNYAPPGSEIYQRYKTFNDTFAKTMQTRYGTYGTSGLNFNDPGHVDARGLPPLSVRPLLSGQAQTQFGTGLVSPTAGLPSTSTEKENAIITKRNDLLVEQKKQIDELNRGYKDSTENAELWGIRQQASTAFTAKYNEVLGAGKDSTDAWNQANLEFNKTRDVALIQLNKDIKIENLRTKGIENSIQSTSADIIKQEAWGRAVVRAKLESIDVNEAYRQELTRGAAEAAKGAAEQIASQIPIVTGLQNQANALKTSELAARNVRIENEANIVVQRAKDAAVEKGVGISKEDILVLKEKAKAQILAREAAQFSMETTRFVNQQTDNQQVLQLQIQMQGQTTEEINRQVVLLQTKQQMERESPGMVESEKNARLAAVDATQRQILALNEAQRVQQRLENSIRSIADTIENTLTRSITDAFDGKKVEDWGTKIKSMLGSITAQITSSQFIKPAIGTILGGVGLTGLAQQFGTFGNSLFGGNNTSGSSNVTLTPLSDGSGGFSLNTAKDALGTGKSIFDMFGGGSSSSSGGGLFGDTFSGLGESFSNTSNFLFGQAATVGSDFGGGGAAMGVADQFGVAQSGLLGSGGAGSFFGGVGAGFGAGSLLNSLVGGNSTFGTIGSGLGSIAGSIIGGPIGGLIGGALGGLLGGMFGSNKKPSNAAGALVDISTGAVSNYAQTGGVNDQAAKGFIQSISQFSTNIQKLSGGGLSGSANPQVFTSQSGKPVYKVDYNDIGDFGSGEIKFSDQQEAMKVISLALARSLTGISDAMKQVISTITDPQLLEAGIQFAKIYDGIKTAADSAFSSIPNDLGKIGPFAEALKQINELFADITEKAIGFGLSLEPVNAALAEATKRLRDDFNRSIEDAILELEDPLKLLVKQEKDAGLARIKEAQAVGGNIAQVNRLNTLMLDKIWENQNRMWEDQIQNLKQLADSLRTGKLSGLTVGGQIEAANDNFRNTLSLVRGGNLNEIDNLTANAGSAFSLSQQAYGNAPQTARLRNEILTSVDGILASRSFATGSDFTPSGWIRVGENGPEWFNQSGGNKVLSSGQQPSGFGEMVAEIRMLRNEVQMLREENTRIMVGVGQDTGKRLDGVRGELRKKPLLETTRARA